MVGVSEWGLKTCEKVQDEYNQHSWEPLKRHFKNPNKA
jgi:homogentisate 1,2-dioxygenase